MTKYSDKEIIDLYNEQETEAKNKLKDLKVFCGNEPNISGLNGWVFEQIIQYCLKKELEEKGYLNIGIEEQYKLEGRKKVDLKIEDNIIVEIKRAGIFGKEDIKRYEKYRKIAKKLTYLYIAEEEGYKSYKEETIRIFGKNNTFFLKEDGWQKFIERIEDILKNKT